MSNEYICSNRTKDLFRIRIKNKNISFRSVSKLPPLRNKINKKIDEFCNELTDNPINMKNADTISIVKNISEWSFYLMQLSLDKNVNIQTINMHIIANMHLKNFGVPTSSKNSRMRELLFFEGAFAPGLFLSENKIYTKSNSNLYVEKGFPDHMEVLFAKVEKELHKRISKYIPKDDLNTMKPISVAIKEQSGFTELRDDLLFKILLSTYIHICEIRYKKQGNIYYQLIENEFSNVEKLYKTLSSMVNRNWIFGHAYNDKEISLPSRGLIRIPELDDAFFFSISRVWGIWIVSSFHSYSNSITTNLLGMEYTPDTVKSIQKSGGDFGNKLSLYLKNYPKDREYFYPYATGLAFRPEVKISSLPITSNRNISKLGLDYFDNVENIT